MVLIPKRTPLARFCALSCASTGSRRLVEHGVGLRLADCINFCATFSSSLYSSSLSFLCFFLFFLSFLLFFFFLLVLSFFSNSSS